MLSKLLWALTLPLLSLLPPHRPVTYAFIALFSAMGIYFLGKGCYRALSGSPEVHEAGLSTEGRDEHLPVDCSDGQVCSRKDRCSCHDGDAASPEFRMNNVSNSSSNSELGSPREADCPLMQSSPTCRLPKGCHRSSSQTDLSPAPRGFLPEDSHCHHRVSRGYRRSSSRSGLRKQYLPSPEVRPAFSNDPSDTRNGYTPTNYSKDFSTPNTVFSSSKVRSSSKHKAPPYEFVTKRTSLNSKKDPSLAHDSGVRNNSQSYLHSTIAESGKKNYSSETFTTERVDTSNKLFDDTHPYPNSLFQNRQPWNPHTPSYSSKSNFKSFPMDSFQNPAESETTHWQPKSKFSHLESSTSQLFSPLDTSTFASTHRPSHKFDLAPHEDTGTKLSHFYGSSFPSSTTSRPLDTRDAHEFTYSMFDNEAFSTHKDSRLSRSKIASHHFEDVHGTKSRFGGRGSAKSFTASSSIPKHENLLTESWAQRGTTQSFDPKLTTCQTSCSSGQCTLKTSHQFPETKHTATQNTLLCQGNTCKLNFNPEDHSLIVTCSKEPQSNVTDRLKSITKEIDEHLWNMEFTPNNGTGDSAATPTARSEYNQFSSHGEMYSPTAKWCYPSKYSPEKETMTDFQTGDQRMSHHLHSLESHKSSQSQYTPHNHSPVRYSPLPTNGQESVLSRDLSRKNSIPRQNVSASASGCTVGVLNSNSVSKQMKEHGFKGSANGGHCYVDKSQYGVAVVCQNAETQKSQECKRGEKKYPKSVRFGSGICYPYRTDSPTNVKVTGVGEEALFDNIFMDEIDDKW